MSTPHATRVFRLPIWRSFVPMLARFRAELGRPECSPAMNTNTGLSRTGANPCCPTSGYTKGFSQPCGLMPEEMYGQQVLGS